MEIVGVDVSYLDLVTEEYDEQLELAIKEFQRIHGLKEDGVIGPNTIRWINFSPQERLHLLALNSERSRIWSKKGIMLSLLTCLDTKSRIGMMVNPCLSLKLW